VNGTAITGLSGATSSLRYWRIAAVAGRPLTIRISGGTGDADLYVRSGSRPTTSTYYCRPYLPANNETCTVSSPSTGDYYIMIRGYSAYSGVTLVGTY
jgi:serine protease